MIAMVRGSAARIARLGLAAVVFLATATQAGAQVLAVMSDGSAGYEAVVDELRSGLADARGGALRLDRVTSAHLDDIDAKAWSGYELVVSVGLAAAQAAVPRAAAGGAGPALLCLLIPRQGYEKLVADVHGPGERRMSAVFIDQPLARQVELMRRALPERNRVGVVLGPSSRELADDLAAAAQRAALSVAYANVDDRAALYPALQQLIPRSDLLLLLPDPVAVNADTIYGLLLTTYRAGVPVVGFSEGLLNAGALLSLFSTAQQQGRQGAEIARRVLAGERSLPEPQYPAYFTVRVNTSVARSLGLRVPDEESLHDAIAGAAARGGAAAKPGGSP